MQSQTHQPLRQVNNSSIPPPLEKKSQSTLGRKQLFTTQISTTVGKGIFLDDVTLVRRTHTYCGGQL